MNDCREIFKNELSKIHDPTIKVFVIQVFELICPDYFWEIAASTSGKYHPLISIGKQGLIRHVKLAAWWGELLCMDLEELITPQMGCEIMATILIHDILKCGKVLTPSGMPKHREIVRTHGVDLGKELRRNKRKLIKASKISAVSFERIVKGVSGHMGKWTDERFSQHMPLEIKDSKEKIVAEVVHLADFISAQKVDSYINELKEN